MGRNRKVRGALSQTLTHGVRAILERNLKTNEFIGFAAMIIGRFGDNWSRWNELALYNFRIYNAFEAAMEQTYFSISDCHYIYLII